MPRKKKNEIDSKIQEKLDYIGLDLSKIPKKLKEYTIEIGVKFKPNIYKNWSEISSNLSIICQVYLTYSYFLGAPALTPCFFTLSLQS